MQDFGKMALEIRTLSITDNVTTSSVETDVSVVSEKNQFLGTQLIVLSHLLCVAGKDRRYLFMWK